MAANQLMKANQRIALSLSFAMLFQSPAMTSYALMEPQSQGSQASNAVKPADQPAPALNPKQPQSGTPGTSEAFLLNETPLEPAAPDAGKPYFSTRLKDAAYYQALLNDPWWLDSVHAEEAWKKSKGQGVIIAIIDTGVDKKDKNLAPNLWTNTREIRGNNKDDDGNGYVDDTWGWDFANNDNDPQDDVGHGTFVASVAASSGLVAPILHEAPPSGAPDGSISAASLGLVAPPSGIKGIAPKAKIMALKAAGKNGEGHNLDEITNAIHYAVDNGAKVINLSMGGSISGLYAGLSSAEATRQLNNFKASLVYADQKGVLIISAAGNEGKQNLQDEMGGLQGTINVGSIDQDNQRADFSNKGAQLMAPGVEIGTNVAIGGGTSASAPIVSGIAALLFAAEPLLKFTEIVARITQSAIDLGAKGLEMDFGYGLVNAAAALSVNWVKPSLASPAVLSTSVNGAKIRANVSGIIQNSGAQAELRICKSTAPVPCQESLVAIPPIAVNNSSKSVEFDVTQLPGNTNYNFTIVLNQNTNQTPVPTVNGKFATLANVSLDSPTVVSTTTTGAKISVNTGGVVPNTNTQLELKVCRASATAPCSKSLVNIPLKDAASGLMEFDISGLAGNTTYTFFVTPKNVNQKPVLVVNGKFTTLANVSLASPTVVSTTTAGAKVSVNVSGVVPNTNIQLELKVCSAGAATPCTQSLVNVPLLKAANGLMNFNIASGLAGNTGYTFFITVKNVNQTSIPVLNGEFKTLASVRIASPAVSNKTTTGAKVSVKVSGVALNTGTQIEVKVCSAAATVPCPQSLVYVPVQNAINSLMNFDISGLSGKTNYTVFILPKNVNQTPVPAAKSSFKTL